MDRRPQLGSAIDDTNSAQAATRPIAAGVVGRHPIECLALLYLLFVLQTGLMPFDFSLKAPTDSGVAVYDQNAVGSFTTPDIVSNVFLYVPVGILAFWSLRRARGRKFGALPMTLCLGLGLSMLIEWAQAYSPTRISSTIDLAANAAGTLIGAVLGAITCHLVPRVIGKALVEARTRPLTMATRLYVLVLVIVAAMPFSVAFDASRLKKAVQKSFIVPFAADEHHAHAVRAAEERGDERGAALASWSRMRGWARYAAECLSFALLTWLLRRLLREEFKFKPGGMIAMLAWIGLSLAVAMSVLQLPIISRGLDGTDVLFRVIGIALGFVTYSRFPLPARDLRDAYRTGFASWSRLASVAAMLVAAFIVYEGIIPLRFSVAASTERAHLAITELAPLGPYFNTRFDIALDDAIQKVTVYGLLSALMCVSWSRLHHLSTRSRAKRLVPLMVLLATAIEVVQIYQPVRVAGITDLVLAVAGCTVGLIVYQQLALFRRLAYSPQAADLLDDHGRFARRLSLTDELIASLAEPYPEAPAEVVPTPQVPQRD